MENIAELRAILLETAEGLAPYVSNKKGAKDQNMTGVIEREFRRYAGGTRGAAREYSAGVFRRLLLMKRLFDSSNIIAPDTPFDDSFPNDLFKFFQYNDIPGLTYDDVVHALDGRSTLLSRKVYIARLLLREYKRLEGETQEYMISHPYESETETIISDEPHYAPDLEDMATRASSSVPIKNQKKKKRLADDITSTLENQAAELGEGSGQSHSNKPQSREENLRKKSRRPRQQQRYANAETSTETTVKTYADAQTSTVEVDSGDGLKRTVEIETQTEQEEEPSAAPIKVTVSTQTQAGEFISDTTFWTERSLKVNWAPKPNRRFVPDYHYSLKRFLHAPVSLDIEMFKKEYYDITGKPIVALAVTDPVVAELGRGSQQDLQAIALGYLRDEELNDISLTDNMYEETRAVVNAAGASTVIYAWGCLFDNDTRRRGRVIYFTHSPFINEKEAIRNATVVLSAPNPYYREIARAYGLQRAQFGCPHKRDGPVCDVVLFTNDRDTQVLMVVYIPWNLRTLRQYFGVDIRADLNQLVARYADMQRAFLQRASLVINDAITLETGQPIPKGTYPFDETTLLAQYTRSCGYPLGVNPTAEELNASDFGNGFTVAVFGLHPIDNVDTIARTEVILTNSLQDLTR